MVIIKECSPTYKYHVFLSFRGEDTRNNFTGHLYSALREKGILTFMDDQLRRGEEISPALIQAIEQSKISIVVFSGNYASSKWCLDELVNILDCKKRYQQIVLPVFFKVDPSEMRNHRGSFGEGLANLERKFKDKDQVQEWKAALFEAASLSGWPLDEHRSESSIIGEIVEHISKEHVNSTELDVAEYQVGIQHRVQAIQKLLGVEGKDVHMVGIWGGGGIGKTTIAKAVYNSIAQKFDGSCFLENVRENSKGARGLVELQKILLREILKERKLKVTSVASGISMIKERLQYKSVLLVLDDVSDMNQLNNLARQCSWFGMGSRIIITTRDKKLLRCHGVHPDQIYEVQELDNHEALELLSVKAFKRIRPLDGYAELTKRAVRYTQGLPLALTVLGTSLRGGNVELWEAALDGSESREIKDVLKISFDGLDHRVKEAFLDIACFFKGEYREHVIKIIKACGSEEHLINVLIQKALISIDKNDRIWMHDLIEEMGRDIVHEQSPDDPGNRSRLWFHEDVYRVLVDNIGTNSVRGIKVELPQDSDVICLCATSFSSMKNLKLIICRAGRYSGVVDGLPNSSRVIDWPDCPLQVLSSHTIPRELSVIHMPWSRITVLGDGYKVCSFGCTYMFIDL
ncbi:PREDICTED: TMV resistance protein N-like [Fragaria vesca subsp. vesca]